MKILYLINHAGKGGSEKYIRSMTEHCLEKGDDIFFAFNEEGLLREQMEYLGVKIFNINMKSPLDICAAIKLANICDRNNIDVIHTQFARENYIAILSKRFFNNKARIIHTCHINTENNIIWKILNKFHMNENFAVIAVCNSVRDKLIENNYPEKKIRVVYNGVKFREDLEKACSSNNFTFVSLARFSEEKGIWFLIRSAEILNNKQIPFELVIAGDGPLYNDVEKYIDSKGLSNVVRLLGYRTDIDEILSSGDCFINSSSSEALSFAILEAMERGLPIIATRVGGNIDIVNNNTKCGLLVDYNDVKAMTDAMQYMLLSTSDTKKMSEYSRIAVKNVFNLDNSIVRTYDIYLEGAVYDNRR